MSIQTKGWCLDGYVCVCFGTVGVIRAAAPPGLSTIDKSIREVMHQLPTSPLRAAKALTCCHLGNCYWSEWPAGIADLCWRTAMTQRQACGWRCHQTPEEQNSTHTHPWPSIPKHLCYHPSWYKPKFIPLKQERGNLTFVVRGGIWKPWIWVINGTPIALCLWCTTLRSSNKDTRNSDLYKVKLCNWETSFYWKEWSNSTLFGYYL